MQTSPARPPISRHKPRAETPRSNSGRDDGLQIGDPKSCSGGHREHGRHAFSARFQQPGEQRHRDRRQPHRLERGNGGAREPVADRRRQDLRCNREGHQQHGARGQPQSGVRHLVQRQRHQGRRRRQQRQDVSRQLIDGEGKEHQHHQRPDGEEQALPVAVDLSRGHQSQQRRPGQQPSQQHWQIEPHRPLMHQRVGGESGEVVDHEELVDECPAVAPVAQRVPGQRHQKEGQHDAPAQPIAHVTPHEQGRGQRQRHQPLGQNGEPEHRRSRRQLTRVAPGHPRQGEQHCRGEGGGQRQVGDAVLAVRHPHAAAAQNQRSEPCGAATEFASERPPIEGQEDDGHQRARQARRQFRVEPQAKPQSAQPIQQRGLFEPGRAPQARCNPIAGARHFARHRRIPRLVRPEQAHRAQIVKVEQVCQRENHPKQARDFPGHPFSMRHARPAVIWPSSLVIARDGVGRDAPGCRGKSGGE